MTTCCNLTKSEIPILPPLTQKSKKKKICPNFQFPNSLAPTSLPRFLFPSRVANFQASSARFSAQSTKPLTSPFFTLLKILLDSRSLSSSTYFFHSRNCTSTFYSLSFSLASFTSVSSILWKLVILAKRF